MRILIHMKERAIDIIIYIAFVIAMLIVLSGKKNLHIDETMTYMLANDAPLKLVDAEIYPHPADVWLDSMTISDRTRFDLETVWKNQANDVHPPLYYIFVNAVCSLFRENLAYGMQGASMSFLRY